MLTQVALVNPFSLFYDIPLHEYAKASERVLIGAEMFHYHVLVVNGNLSLAQSY